jgi:hypothetical protein
MDFNKFEEGDEIDINYTVYQTVGTDGGEQETTVSTEVVNASGELNWKAGRTGTGIVTSNGIVYDGNGLKVGVDATVSKKN